MHESSVSFTITHDFYVLNTGEGESLPCGALSFCSYSFPRPNLPLPTCGQLLTLATM